MSVRFYALEVDCHDVRAQGYWWAKALGWEVTNDTDGFVAIESPHQADESRAIPLAERGPGIIFVPVPESKTLKNRLHLDLAPGPEDDQAAEVRRLETLGARRADVGQGSDVPWVVLTDPEGNEFCVLTSRD